MTHHPGQHPGINKEQPLPLVSEEILLNIFSVYNIAMINILDNEFIYFIFQFNSLPKSIRLKTVVTMNITTETIALLQYQQRGIASLLKATGIFPQQPPPELVITVMQSTEEPQ